MNACKKLLSVALALSMCLSVAVSPAMATDEMSETAETDLSVTQTETAETWEPENLNVDIGASENSVSLTWYDTNADGDTLIWNGTEYPAAVTAASKDGYYTNRVTVSGLKSFTTYSYIITSGANTSPEYTYTTSAQGKNVAFSFAAVGDPQIGASGNAETDTESWNSTMSVIENDGTDYAFVFSLGDQINTYYDGTNGDSLENEYSGFLSAFAAGSTLLATLVGNHDAGRENSTLYTEHYTMPNVTAYGQNQDGDGDYSFTYNGVLFMVLNSSNLSIADHKQFMEETIAANPDANWKIVCFHKSIYSVASHVTESDIETLRTGLSPILNELDVDLVLQGHDHVYARSYIMGGESGMDACVTDTVETDIINPDGVQYVTLNSSSGSKYYNITQEAFTYTAVQNQEKVPNYSKVTVCGNALSVTTYRTTDGSVVDTFTIHKTAEKKDCILDQFLDLDKTAYYYESVNAVVKAALMYGESITEFAPEDFVTRAMAVAVLYRMAGSPAVTEGTNFADVPADEYYADAVLWAKQTGIVAGTSATTFSPDDAITREQFIAMLSRYAEYYGMDLSSGDSLEAFTDAGEISEYAVNAMNWAVGCEIVAGTSATTLGPQETMTRAQFACFVDRYQKLA